MFIKKKDKLDEADISHNSHLNWDLMKYSQKKMIIVFDIAEKKHKLSTIKNGFY